jgi:hypothetical protein
MGGYYKENSLESITWIPVLRALRALGRKADRRGVLQLAWPENRQEGTQRLREPESRAIPPDY